jgi:hypothetical protein
MAMNGMMGWMHGWGIVVVLLLTAILVALVLMLLRGRGKP